MTSCTAHTAGFARRDCKWLHAAAALAFIYASAPNMPLLAQGLDSDKAVDAIVGSQVKTEETHADAETGRILAAIADTEKSTEKVRETFNLDELDIVFVPDIDDKGSAIETALAGKKSGIKELRTAIESSALFFHAVDSRSVEIRDILAAEFTKDTVTLFVRGSDPAQ